MNSKTLVILSFLLLSSCGVKGDPTFPKDATLPSVSEQYPDIKLENPLDETKKK